MTYVYKWLHGACPAPETLNRLAKDLHVSAAWLLFGDVEYLPLAVGARRPLAIWRAPPPRKETRAVHARKRTTGGAQNLQR